MKVILSVIIASLFATYSVESSLSDPVLEFEKLLDQHFESYEINPREGITKLGGGWVRERFSLEGTYTYDVQTTNSLVSPYKGICDLKLKRSYTGFYKTKDGALLDNEFVQSDDKLHSHKFLYQKGKWIVSERKSKGFSDWYDCDEVIQKAGGEILSNIHGCWEG